MKKYIEPAIKAQEMETEDMIAATTLNANESSQSIEPTSEPYNGTFGAKNQSVWDSQTEEDN